MLDLTWRQTFLQRLFGVYHRRYDCEGVKKPPSGRSLDDGFLACMSTVLGLTREAYPAPLRPPTGNSSRSDRRNSLPQQKEPPPKECKNDDGSDVLWNTGSLPPAGGRANYNK